MMNKKIKQLQTIFTIEKIKFLNTLVEEKNFKIAAERLNTTESNLRFQLEILERESNLKILLERKNKIFLTENGELFYRYGVKIYALYEELIKIMNEISNSELIEISIGGDLISGAYLMTKVITILKKKYKEITIQLIIDSNPEILKKIKTGALSFGLIRGNLETSFKALNFIEVYPFAIDFLVLVTSKFQPFSLYKLILLKHQLYDLNWIVFSRESENRILVDEILRKNNIFPERFNVVLELDSLEAIKIAVESGLGVAFVPLLSVQKELQFELIKSFTIKNFKAEVPIYLILNRKNYSPRSIYLFLKEMDLLVSKTLTRNTH